MSCHVMSCQRRRAVPLRPIWTITVAAKLDQIGVLVIKFRQNRLTLKGRSAGQRHTDRHTDRQTRVKITALQVCNRANIKQVIFRLCQNIVCRTTAPESALYVFMEGNSICRQCEWFCRYMYGWIARYGHCEYIFMSEFNNAHIIRWVLFQQLFWVAECCMAACFSQIFHKVVWRHVVAICRNHFSANLLASLSCWWKKFENRFRFNRVTVMTFVSSFSGTQSHSTIFKIANESKYTQHISEVELLVCKSRKSLSYTFVFVVYNNL